jgi:NADPH:quinone reductase-like Zn-dependent oxidoreductase
MRAVVQDEYGSLDLLRLDEVPRPGPRDDEVLIRVRAAAVTLSDTITRTGRPLFARFFTGLLRPRQHIQGSEFAGEVAAVGRDVTVFDVGDEVFGVTGSAYGCFAEFMSMPADGLLAIKPTNMGFDEAASVCGALAAWNFLHDKADVRTGQRVLVNGASGAIGTAAIQVAKHLGARVTGVCGTGELELVASLGADEVIDDTREDFTSNGELYDVVFDAESTSSYRRCRGSLAQNGVYLRTFPGPVILLQMFLTSYVGRKRAIVSATGLMPIAKRRAFLDEVTKLVEAGEMRSVIDRSFPLERLADAYRHAERGTLRGTVVVTMEPTG